MHGDAPKPADAKTAPATGRRWGVYIAILLMIALAGAVYYAFSGSTGGDAQQRGRGRFARGNAPVPVLADIAKRADVPVYIEAVGTARALNIVTVRPQVDGKLIAINFKEGQDVKKGDVLARIDPTTYQAQLDQAVAKKAQDEAQLSNARRDLERYERLAATNSINQQQADTQKALVAQLGAQVQSDQAAIDNARAILGYTTIVAPIDGRTGIRAVDEGNIVRSSDTSGIVVITQIRPISVVFNIPQQNLDQVNSAFEKDALPVDTMRSDTDAIIDHGALTVVDNQVDQSTGTVRLKAELPNRNLQLWPGQFVNVRLLVDTLKQVIVVPTGAVQRGPKGTFVYTVKDDNTVAVRNVTVTRQDELQAVIGKGLEPGEKVVTTGFVNLTDGSKISVSSPQGAAPAAGAPQSERRNGERSGARGQRRNNAAPSSSGGGTAQ
ncbi:MAG: efflux RND transporter periplasmic adaptor subunit [Xanthobacteraceae bacterium]|jgi:multidrug efflux system membrane fusion protein|uniref:efflux RND transporter periplasmic adaptor subunit n=1 Tax=Pseudolabrys sp. TaxID=1960880 RepID=UPI003D107312